MLGISDEKEYDSYNNDEIKSMLERKHNKDKQLETQHRERCYINYSSFRPLFKTEKTDSSHRSNSFRANSANQSGYDSVNQALWKSEWSI